MSWESLLAFNAVLIAAIASPGASGNGVYSATLDVSKLSEGFHYIEAIGFRQRHPGLPPIFESFRKVILVDRSS